MNKPITSGRITRWLLLLHEFNITIIDKPGKENLVANFLSRLTHTDDNVHVDDTFLYEHLFDVSIKTPWFEDIANYLVTGKIPAHLSSYEK